MTFRDTELITKQSFRRLVSMDAGAIYRKASTNIGQNTEKRVHTWKKGGICALHKYMEHRRF